MFVEQRSVAIRELGSTPLFELAEAHRDERYVCLLESTSRGTPLGRYSFLCIDPFWIFTSKRRACFSGPPGKLRRLERDPLVELTDLLARHRFPTAWEPGLPPFLGGAIGYLGYELLYLLEQVPDHGSDDRPVADSELLFFDTVFASDAETHRTWCISNGFGPTENAAKRSAHARLEEMIARIRSRSTAPSPAAGSRMMSGPARSKLTDDVLAAAKVTPVMNHERYLDVVREAKSEIALGNVFEVCTTNRFDTNFGEDAKEDGFELYRTLRETNPAPFASYLKLDGVEVISSSPERFVKIDRQRWVETRPMKGTRRRGATKEADDLAIADLRTCEKSAAENMMIVDLARNDLGRVCKFRTVEVPELRAVETYPYTHQLVSTVRGQLVDGLDIVDVIRATFPGGSMTGAPKIEALKIIDRLEPVKRGIYSGSIGYIDFDGAMDTCIVIRTMIKKGDSLSFHVGGAIVADSEPEDEYQETLDKAHALVDALELTRERSGR